MRSARRAISPVVGVSLMIVLTLLLASVFAVGLDTFTDGLDEKKVQYDESASTVTGNPWSGSEGDVLRLSNAEAGATDVRARINFTIRPGSDTIGNSLNSIYVEITTGSPDVFTETKRDDLVEVAIDEGSDGTLDREITGDVDGWDIEEDGSGLEIEFTGSAYTAQANDSIVVVVEDVNNPEDAGTYDLRADTSDDDNWHYGEITIVE